MCVRGGGDYILDSDSIMHCGNRKGQPFSPILPTLVRILGYLFFQEEKEHRKPFSEAAQKEGFLRGEPVPLPMEQCDGWL